MTHALLVAGFASWYSRASSGTRTASGQTLIDSGATCAMRYVRLGTRVRIENTGNGAVAYCVVNDRGPYVAGRVIDVTPAVRDRLRMGGEASVKVFLM